MIKPSKKTSELLVKYSHLLNCGYSVNYIAKTIYDSEGIEVSFNYFRQSISKSIVSGVTGYEMPPVSDNSKSPVKSEPEPKPFVLSAWDFEGEGRMMDIDEYCEKYRLPRQNVMNYRLVTHTGTPYYNTSFKDVHTFSSIISKEFIEETIAKYIKPVGFTFDWFHDKDRSSDWFDRLVYTDAHIGMDTDKDGVALYSTLWNKKAQLDRAAKMVDDMLADKKGSVLYVTDLADFMDGWDGFTTRGGHPLPQNMSNHEAFEVGIEFKMLIADRLVLHYDKVYFDNVCNDKHAGEFGYIVNIAFKQLCEAKYGKDKVEVRNHPQFIDYYLVGRHAFVISHGKDNKALKFGFKPKLDAVQIEKIDAFLKFNGIYKKADFIEFSKGDSHQMLLDYCTSDDFDYFNYPSFSPASEWVQTNFKKSRSGFVIQHVMYNENVKQVSAHWF
jgi:hypothetical protein